MPEETEEAEEIAGTNATGQLYPEAEAPEEAVESEEYDAALEGQPSRATLAAQQAGEAVRRLGERMGAGAQGLLGRVGEGMEPPPDLPRDGLRDLFEVPDERDPDMYIDDLTEVSEEDVFGDGGSDMSDLLDVTDEDLGVGSGDMSDILEVSKEDIMGTAPPSREQQLPASIPPGYRPRSATRIALPPTGLSQLR